MNPHTFTIRIEATLPFDHALTRNPTTDIDNPDGLWTHVLSCAAQAGLTVLTSQCHRFVGGGLTGTAILAESALAIHTWPEDRFALIEATTCGADTATRAFANLIARSASRAFVDDGQNVTEYAQDGRKRFRRRDATLRPWSLWD